LDQRLSLLTIGVKDLKLIREFYEKKFQWKVEAGNSDIVFFKLNGLLIGFFSEKSLAKDAGVAITQSRFKPFSLAQNFSSIEKVDQQFKVLKERGVKIIKNPEKVFWGGYSGYVADPEDNLWEIAFNPFIKLDSAGNVLGHAEIKNL